MPKYIVTTEWSGYSRGFSTWLVDADSPEQARETYYYEGNEIDRETIRNDTEGEVESVELMQEPVIELQAAKDTGEK